MVATGRNVRLVSTGLVLIPQVHLQEVETLRLEA